jgi:hypothetical protein
MNHFVTSGGRLLSVEILGSRPTLQDTMVAADLYLRLLEESFSDAEQLVSCVEAWAEDDLRGPGTLSDEALARCKLWTKAHALAQRTASTWLSDPAHQSFRLLHRLSPSS